MSQIKRNKALL